MRIGIWTCAELPQLTDDDRLLVDELRRRGHDLHVKVWNEVNGDGDTCEAWLIRSIWDYHQHEESFRSWLAGLERAGTPILNEVKTVLWNMDKSYLGDLEAKGLPIVPTIYARDKNLSTPLQGMDAGRWVFKPVVSASAHGTWVAEAPLGTEERQRLEAMVGQGTVMVQPFIQEIVTEGEWSFMFFDDVFSHAVLKRPGQGDFRVQHEWGGSTSAGPPSDTILAQAKDMYRATGLSTCYARLDAVEVEGQLRLMELELIEPDLFLAWNEAAPSRLADAVEKRLP